jgi:ribosome-binding factor A
MARHEERAGHRHARLQELLLHELRAYLRDDATDPALEGVTITGVSLSPDYRHARVHFALREEPGDDARLRRLEAEEAMERASAWLRTELAVTLDLKRTPDLRFVFDSFLEG